VNAVAQEPAPPSQPQLRVPWTGPPVRDFAFAYENGLFGHGFGQGIRVKIPFHAHWGMNVRGLSVFRTEAAAEWILGGRIEYWGQSPIFLNLVRLYGGGGPQLFVHVKGGNNNLMWGGGGQFGFEFFANRRMAFFLEVGGNGGGDLPTGATVLAGMNVYPF
jgi:hypothetical protein